MSTAAAVTLPGSRVLPTWWREAGGWSPRRAWYAHLILHRVEALVELDQPSPLTGLARAMKPLVDGGLGGDLALEPELARALQAEARRNGEAGSPRCRQERRVFYFVDSRPPQYLPLAATATQPLPPPANWRFELGVLEGCVGQPPAWKERHGFPAAVTMVVRPGGELTDDNWLAVPMDRPEQAHLLLVEPASGGLVGLPVQPATWALGHEPALRLRADDEGLAAFAVDVGVDAWRQAWQAWCQQRSLPASEVEASKLELVGHRLVVRTSLRLVERLRQAKSEALRGEAWLLAGTGRVRALAVVELVC